MMTGASNVTYLLDNLCPEGGCEVDEMTHYGEPGTSILWCHAHGEVVGEIVHHFGGANMSVNTPRSPSR